MWQFSFKITVIVHFLICLGNVCSFFILPFIESPWVAFPCCSLVIFLTFQREVQCPLTRLENYLRDKLGMPPIKTFIGHYILKPLRERSKPITTFQGVSLK